MAVVVTIKSEGLFKTKIEFKDILFPQMRYGIMDEAYRLEEGNVGENIVVFNEKHICRGCEVSFKQKEISLRMPLPTSKEDIYFFYELVQKICKRLHTKKFIRDEEKLTLTDISHCIELDIQASSNALVQIEKDLYDNKYENFYIFGAINPISIGKDEIGKIHGSIEKLGELLDSLQSRDFYYAKAKVYQKKDDSYFGVYVLTADVSSIFPYRPKLLISEQDFTINDWYVGFVANQEMKGFIPYSDFVNFVKECEKYDSEHFIVTMNQDMIKKLIDEYKVDL